MKAWSSWYDDLLPSLPGCTTAMVTHELRRAAQDFFVRSRSWGVVLESASVAIDEGEVEVLPDDSQQSIVRVESSTWNGNKLDVKSIEEIDAEFGADWMDQVGTPSAITQIQHGTVRLVPVPDAAGLLRCRLTVKPSDSASGLPDALAFQYRDALANGAKARLMLMPKKPWSDGTLGAVASGFFEDALESAKSSASIAFGRGRVKSTPVWC